VPWDRERYRLEVLEPARQAGNVPPADLYVRYGLPSDIANPAAFGQQVHEVIDYWRELRSSRVYARLADALIARHAELAPDGPLTLEKFTQRHAQAHREQTDQLARLADAEAGAATHVGPATVARLRSALGRSVTDAEVTEALQRAGVRVVAAFPQLPAAPHPKQWYRFFDSVTTRLGDTSSWNGQRITQSLPRRIRSCPWLSIRRLSDTSLLSRSSSSFAIAIAIGIVFPASAKNLAWPKCLCSTIAPASTSASLSYSRYGNT